MNTSVLTNKSRLPGNNTKFLDTHKCKGLLKSSKRSITQIYSLTQKEQQEYQWDFSNWDFNLTTPMYHKSEDQVVNAVVESK
jgi:hypothetical protein